MTLSRTVARAMAEQQSTWEQIPEKRQMMREWIDQHNAWTIKADAAYLNRHLLHPQLDRAWPDYQRWLAENPEPKCPFCPWCGIDHGNADCEVLRAQA